MPVDNPPVSIAQVRQHVKSSLSRYWQKNPNTLDHLPIPKVPFPDVDEAPSFVLVELPKWGKQFGVNGCMLIPRNACSSTGQPSWWEVDWWLAAFLMLECWAERYAENLSGPIHSYSWRLKGWDTSLWDYAWVNRIALFIRQWVSVRKGMPAEKIFGLLPSAKILLTHDVDAVQKTLPIRLKQSGFYFFNTLKLLRQGIPLSAFISIKSAFFFLLGNERWNVLERVIKKLSDEGLIGHFNFYADTRRKSFKRWLFDPSYDVGAPPLSCLIKRITNGGGSVGLHPTYDSWRSEFLISEQKKVLEAISGAEVFCCRQHWLRFSWKDTWHAQEKAGFRLDTTLMFNDRPGFRSASAIQWSPWNDRLRKAYKIQALPTILMDSHFYDYDCRTQTDASRKKQLKSWVDEVRFVGGVAAVLWHPHTLSADYGWAKGFEALIDILKED